MTLGAHGLDVAAGAKVTAGAGQDHDTRQRVGLDLVERGEQLAAHDQIERVAGLGAIEGDRSDGAVAFDVQRLVTHGMAPFQGELGVRAS